MSERGELALQIGRQVLELVEKVNAIRGMQREAVAVARSRDPQARDAAVWALADRSTQTF